MLPWLVIPLIGLWFLSQFLPPAFRFEITSPRLACVFVLLITLFWYEILMPQLSAWRVRRNARLRERKRSEAIEMQKLRKTATRRCRNCLTPYRDQNPGGGRFMCSYCGHISKRPVLDLPIPPGLGGLSNSGILKDLVGKGGKMLNGKVWSDNGWICGQDWLENSGNWVGGSFSGNPSFRGKNDDHCFAEKSYSSLVIFVCKILAAIFLGVMWLWRKIFRVSSSDEDTSGDTEIRNLAKKGENGINCNESRGEKARRKAEEKRQARLEKEQLEEEERKQREEVARLVEERRKLRDEKTEAEKDRSKVSTRDKNSKKESEKKKKKEKDRGSSKSNSDVDEIEKRAVKEIERNRNHRVVTPHNNNIGSVGTRYLDRMKGSFLSSSRAFTGSGFFGKGNLVNTSNIKEYKSIPTSDHPQKKEVSKFEKSNPSTDDKNSNRPVLMESQSFTAPKKSWQQLFTRTSTDPSSSTTNVISRPKGKSTKEVQSPISSNYPTTQGFDNPITFGLPYTLPNFSYGLQSNSTFQAPDKIPHEESDIFEDPCYVPDPVALIGPVSESLDNFQLDLGFVPDLGFQKPNSIKHVGDLSDGIKPSPIESPMSRLRISDSNSSFFNGTSTPQDMHNLQKEDQNEKGWQMWESSPLYRDPSSWLLPPEVNEGVMQMQLQPQKTMASLFKRDDHNQVVSTTQSTHRPNGTSTTNHQFQLSQGNFWAKKERGASARAVGGLYSTPDVQSLWSYE
ncbi:hypothetical protein L2E82_51883 [Cichorium intybus]|nr:hypothetical protein L2E82_51883 [Cichorium intybus]